MDRSTITRAVREIRPLLAARGFAVPGEPGLRLRTLADVFAYAAAEGVELRMDGTEVQVRRPRAGKPGRRAFVSGKKKQNTKKATVITDDEGRTLWAGAFRPGRMHDQTAVRTEGIADLFTQYPRGQGQGRCRVPGPGQGVPRPGPGPAAEAEEGRHRRGNRRLGSRTSPAVLGTDLRRARQRRAQAMADPPALPRTTRRLRRDLPGHRRTGLRPRRRAVTPASQPARPARPDPNRAPRRKSAGGRRAGSRPPRRCRPVPAARAADPHDGAGAARRPGAALRRPQPLTRLVREVGLLVRCQCCHWSSPAGPLPNPAYASPQTGLSTCLACWSAADGGCWSGGPGGGDGAAAVAVALHRDTGRVMRNSL